jgi:O-acetyl-ADP-ribose deacetylase (regulator of RNase III)
MNEPVVTPTIVRRPAVVQGDLFESRAQTLVNTVNTVGVMGKGVALEFKQRYPEMYQDYVRRCARHEVKLGRPYLFQQLVGPWILNFPTKDHWRSLSRLSDIVDGLDYLRDHYKEWGITSLAVPPLGSGNGGLEWRVVGRSLYRILSTFDIPVEIYAPHGAPAEELTREFLADAQERPNDVDVPRLSAASVALVEILNRIESQPYHWPVGRVAFQKMAYFATEAGLPTGLEFVRGSYGPFAPGLKQVESRLINNAVLSEAHMGKMIVTQVGPTFHDGAELFGSQLRRWEPIIERIVDLFLRMRGQDAEIAATVHFAAERLIGDKTEPTEKDVLDAVLDWKQRRRPPLRETDIARAIRNLNLMGWISLTPSQDLPLGLPDPMLF